MEQKEPSPRRVHQSLIKTPLYAGVDKGFLLFEGCTIGFLFFALGFHLATVAIAALYAAALHPLMAWINARDPLLAVLYVRSLGGKDFYAPHAKLRAGVPTPRPSIPRKR